MSEYYDQRGAGNLGVNSEKEGTRKKHKAFEGEDGKTYVAVQFPAIFQLSLEGDLSALGLLLAQGVDPNVKLTREMLEECMPELDGDMTFPVQGWTPLHFAASAGHIEIAALLRSRGADMKAITPQGMSAADVALYSASMERQNFPKGSARYSIACSIALRCEAFAETFASSSGGKH